MIQFLKDLHAFGIKARKRTESERRRAFIDFSLHHDFRDGFRPREHRCDAFSLASQESQNLGPLIGAEKRDQEIEYLKDVLRSLDIYKGKLEARSIELEGERGPLALMERQRILRDARLRIAAQV